MVLLMQIVHYERLLGSVLRPAPASLDDRGIAAGDERALEYEDDLAGRAPQTSGSVQDCLSTPTAVEIRVRQLWSDLLCGTLHRRSKTDHCGFAGAMSHASIDLTLVTAPLLKSATPWLSLRVG